MINLMASKGRFTMKKVTKRFSIFFGIIALSAIIVCFCVSCEQEPNDTNPDAEIPAELQNTTWYHREGDSISFDKTKVTVKTQSGTEQSFTVKETSSFNEGGYNQIILFFNLDNKLTDTITYRNGEITFVSLGGVNKADYWSMDDPNDDPYNNINPGEVHLFTDSYELTTWLENQPANDKYTPYVIKFKFENTDPKYYRIPNDRYVILDFSGSNLWSLPEMYRADDKTLIVGIIIPSSVTSIHTLDFYHYKNLAIINIDENNIYYSSDQNVVYNKNKTILITFPQGKSNPCIIPNSVTSIEEYAFSYCSNLTSITIPSSVTSIGERAFYDCSNLTSITIPPGVTSIEKFTFGNCKSLTSITIPSNVTYIEGDAFSYCSNLTSITIPSSVTSIGERAFLGCPRLTSITIGSDVDIYYNSFLSYNFSEYYNNTGKLAGTYVYKDNNWTKQ